jgi:autotransporter passenger strand-loop-strand repeat protein
VPDSAPVRDVEYVSSGGTASGTTVSSGGREVVYAGGTVSGITIGAGTLEVASGGSTGSGPVTFVSSGGGTLQLDNSVSFGGTITGFGQPEYLDLRDIAFGSNTTLNFTEAGNNLSGNLTVSDGTNTANSRCSAIT